MLFDSLRQALSSKPSQSHDKEKTGRENRKTSPIQHKRLNFEPLENRELLSVNFAEFEAIRSTYDDLNLSKSIANYNVIEIHELSEDAFRAALDQAAITAKDDLIVVRTGENAGIDLGDRTLDVDIDARRFGGVNIVSLGQSRLEIRSRSADGIINVVQGDLSLGGVVLVGLEAGLENGKREAVSVFELLVVADTARVRTSHVVKVSESGNPAGNYSLFGDYGTSSTDVLPTSGGSPIGSKSYSVTVGVGGTYEAYLTGISYGDLSLIVAGSTGFLADLTPFDAEKNSTGNQSNTCWAATSANMLSYAGWGDVGAFQNEDEIYDYFLDNFTDLGGNSVFGIEWFLTGRYVPAVDTGTYPAGSWAQLKNTDTGGFYQSTVTDFHTVGGSSSVASVNDITAAVDRLKAGNAVGLSLGWYNASHVRSTGHAITLWGAVYDTALSPLSSDYYVSLIVSDSDDNKFGGAGAVNTLKNLAIDYETPYGQYAFTDYPGSLNGYLESYTWLVGRDATPDETFPDLRPYKLFDGAKESIVVHTNEFPEGSKNYQSWTDAVPAAGGQVYVSYAFINRGTASAGPFKCTVTLSGGNLGAPVVKTQEIPYDDFVVNGFSAYSNVDFGPLGEGTYTVTVKLNSNADFPETDALNNVFEKNFTIGVTTVASPTDLQADTVTNDSVTLRWTGTATNYVVRYRAMGEVDWTVMTPQAATTATVSGLTVGMPYEFQVKGVNGDFCSDWAGLSVVTASPTAPTNLTATLVGQGQVTLNWSGGDAGIYNLYRLDGAVWTKIAANVTGTEKALTDLLPGVYTYAVTVTAGGVESPMRIALPVGVRYPAPTGLVCGTPTALNALGLTWNAAADAVSYVIRYKTGADSWTETTVVATGGSLQETTVAGLGAGQTYSFQVKSVAAGGLDSEWSDTATGIVAMGVLPVPSDFVAGTTAMDSVSLSWNKVDNTTKYVVRYQTAGGAWSSGTNVTATGDMRQTTTITGLSPGTTYSFQIMAVGTPGVYFDSDWSGPLDAATAIPVPTNVRTVGKTGSVGLTWDAIAGATGYKVYRSTSAAGSYVFAGTSTTADFTDDQDLSDATIYYYRVTALFGTGESNRSATVAAATATAAMATGSGSGITIGWQKVDGCREYKILRSQNGASGPFTELSGAVVGPNGTSYADVTAEYGVMYYYVVRVFVDNDNYTDSKAVGAVRTFETPEVTGTSASIVGRIDLAWNDSLPEADGYRIYRSTTGAAGSFTSVGVSQTGSYSDQAVAPGTRYFYRIAAYKGSYEGPLSDPAEGVTKPVAAVSLAADGNRFTGEKMTFTVNDTNGNATTYRVFINDTETSVDWSGKSFQYSFAAAGTYVVKVVPRNVSGEATATDHTVTIDLAVPNGLTATVTGVAGVRLSWTAVPGAARYYVYRSENPDSGFEQIQIVTGTTCNDSAGLNPNTAYYYKVQANDGVGDGARSAAVQVMTLPESPASFAVGTVTDTSVSLSWSAVTGVTEYVVTYTTGSTVKNVTVTGISTTLTDLAAGSAYSFEIRAKNAAGGLSDAKTATAATLLAAPTDFIAGTVTSSTVALSWALVDGATGYVVSYTTGSITENVTVTGTSTILTGLAAESTYTLSVKAISAAAESTAASLSITTLADLPLTVSVDRVTSTSVTLSWNPIAGAAEYVVTYTTGSTSRDINVDTASATLTDLEPGTVYSFIVRVKDSDESATAAATTILDAPDVFSVGKTTMNSVVLTWSSVAGATEYVVTYTAGSIVRSATLGGTTATLTGLTSGTAYSFTVKAKNGVAESSVRMADATTLSDTSSPFLMATPQGDNVLLSWSNVGAAYYSVWRSNGGTGKELVSNTTSTMFVDDSPQTGLNRYVVYAHGGSMKVASNNADVEIESPVKTSVHLTASKTGAGVSLSWTDVGASRYAVWRLNGDTWTVLTADTASTTLVDTSAPSGENLYVVYAYKGSETALSNGVTVEMAADTVPLLTATERDGEVRLSWTDVGASHYGVWRLSGETWTALTTDTGSTNHTDASASAGTNLYVVYAYRGSEKIMSNSVSVEIETGGTVPHLSASQLGKEVSLSWTDVGASHYGIWRLSGDAWTALKTDATGTTFVDSSAPVGTNLYVVYAYHGSEKTLSNSVTVETTAGAAPVLEATKRDGDAVLSWTDVGASYYGVWRLSGEIWTALKTDATGTTFTDSSAPTGTNLYVVYAYFGSEKVLSNGAAVTVSTIVPPVLSAVPQSDSVALSWTDVGVSRYAVWRLTGGTWTLLEENVTSTSYIDRTVSSGSHRYVVYAYDGSEKAMSNDVLASFARMQRHEILGRILNDFEIFDDVGSFQAE